MKVYLVMGGCIDDQHIINIYDTTEAAEARARRENLRMPGLNAYVEAWNVSTNKK